MYNLKPSKCDFMYDDIVNKIHDAQEKGFIKYDLGEELIQEIKDYGKQTEDDLVAETQRLLNCIVDDFGYKNAKDD